MRAALLLAAVALLASSPARAHGASRGLHLHLVPDSAAPGTTIEIDADAALPVARLSVGFAEHEPVVIEPKVPGKRVVAKCALPTTAKPGTTINVMAEAKTAEGKILRASGLVRVVEAETRP